MDKYIFISGASRGIGRAIALKFASFGHNLIIVSSNSEKDLTDTMEEIKKFNVKCRAFTLSVADFNSLESMKETLHNEDIFVEMLKYTKPTPVNENYQKINKILFFMVRLI